jgi:dCTP deaminase
VILSGASIKERGIFLPFSERSKFNGMTFGLGPAGYDVRIAENISLNSQRFSLASTLEHITMPNDLLGIVHDKSTFARMGLALQNTVIEPGWRGYLTLELSNHSSDLIFIPAGSPIAQIVFHVLDKPTQPYEGRYQDQEKGAQKARFFSSDL